MDPETIKVITSGGSAVGAGAFGLACLGTLIWVVKFIMTRMEVAIKDNTDALKALVTHFRKSSMYESGGKDAAE